MWVWILWVVVGLLVVALGAFTTLLMAMRTKNRRALLMIRRLGRWGTNHGMARSAGEPGSSTALIRHVGRRSGAPYVTPIGVLPMDGEFLVYLPYGPEVDWLRNLRAAGSAELRVDGITHTVSPRMVEPTEALAYLSARERRSTRLFGITDFLALRRVPVTSGGPL
ncbi:nitroreductase family deazaflavin-dependent oxidoreductase [Promicromonospora sp. NPDC052451]|uniref:nitroreductase family deazaflavin-dependent oxidoreductase n=1 Tax=Promicromonospora sp. NPDC052451 TaxID=3364407 RepID=UPI0037C5BB99